MKKSTIFLVLLMVFGSAAMAQRQANILKIWETVSPQQRGEQWVEIYSPHIITVESDEGLFRYLYSYDEEDYYLTTLETQQMNASDEWIPVLLESYEYNFDGNVMEVLTTDLVSDENLKLETRSYADDMLSEVLYQEWVDDEWVNVTKEVYNFTETSCSILFWSWSGSNWAPDNLYTITQNDDEVELLIQYMQGGAWQNSERQTTRLNDDGTMAEVLYETWTTNTWTNAYQKSYHYTGDLFNTVTVLKWDGSSWVDHMEYEYEYDDHGNAISGECSMKVGDEWEYVDGTFEIAYDHNYDFLEYVGWRFAASYIDVTGVEEAGEADVFSFYPNPVKDILVIKAENFQKAEVFNLMGAKITETTSKTLDMSGMASGLYLLRVYDMSGFASVRTVVVE